MFQSTILKKSRFTCSFFVTAKKYFFLAGALLFVLSFLISNNYFPWHSFYNEFAAFLSLLFFAQVTLLSSSKITYPRVSIFIFILGFVPLLQSAFGVIYFWGDGFVASAYILLFSLAIVVGNNLYNQSQISFLNTVAICLVLAAFISSFIAIYQWFGLDDWGVFVLNKGPGGRSYANLGQPNNLATLLCLGLVSLLYLWEKKNISSALAVLMSILLLVGVVLAMSRTSWLMAGLFIIWVIWKKSQIKLRINYWFIFTFVVFYIGLFVLLPLLTNIFPLLSISYGGIERVAEIDVPRLTIWNNLYHALINGPWWGYGWNQTGLAQAMAVAELQPEFTLYNYTAHAHNFALDLLLWNGPILGTFLIAGILYWGLLNAFSCKTLEAWYGLLFVGMLLIHSTVEFPLHFTYFLLPLGLIVGVIISENGKAESKEYLVPGKVLQFAVLTFATLGAILFYEYTILEEDTRLMRFETTRIAISKSDKKAPNVFFLNQLREYNRYARTTAKPDMSDEELDWMRKVAHRYAVQPALFRYALALKLNGRDAESDYELLRMRGLYGEEVYKGSLNHIRNLSN